MRAAACLFAVVCSSLLAACGSTGEPPRAVRPLELRPAPTVTKAPKEAAVRAVARRAEPPPRFGTPSRAIGKPHRGRLEGGVQLPAAGADWVTWDPVRDVVPNRGERRWGTDRLVATVQRVLAEYRAANPGAPRVLVGDLSRPRGGVFDQRYGGLGHASHQNGLDVDVYYPRKDRREREAFRVAQVDRRLSQDLVDRFVAAAAQFVFVGYEVRPRGPEGVVQSIPHHENHLHVRIR